MTKNKTKKGAASIYAVVFITLLLGIIAVSFVRVILRESTGSVNSELSASSRDAALAGVEDAKRAIDKYNKSPAGSFSFYKTGPTGAEEADCEFVKKVLTDGTGSGETILATEEKDGAKTEQAYTCVTVDPYSPDYKGTLDSSKSVAVIPLEYDKRPGKPVPEYVTFSWQKIDSRSPKYPNSSSYKALGEQTTTNASEVVPPVISLQYVQVPNKDAVNSIDDYKYDAASDNTGLMFLTPQTTGSLSNVGDIIQNRDNTTYEAKKVKCRTTSSGPNGDEYMCSAKIRIKTASGPSATSAQYLIVSLPYQSGATDFRVSMSDAANNIAYFYGVQYVIDSTGRANDLYTRLEVRLNNVDPNFPYPQFALQSEGSLEKAFWVTNGCLKVDYAGDGLITAPTCENSGDL